MIRLLSKSQIVIHITFQQNNTVRIHKMNFIKRPLLPRSSRNGAKKTFLLSLSLHLRETLKLLPGICILLVTALRLEANQQ